MYLAGAYCYGTNGVTPQGVLTLLAQKNYGNPPKPAQTQEFGAKTRGYVVLSGVMSRSKELKIPRSCRACPFKSGPREQFTTSKKPPSFCEVAFASKPPLVVFQAYNYCNGKDVMSRTAGIK